MRFRRADAELFDEIVGATRAVGADELRLEPVARGQARHSVAVRIRAIAAAATVVVAGLAVWRLNGDEGSVGSATTVTAETHTVPRGELSWPPRLLLDDSWTVVYADEDPMVARGEVRFVRGGDEVSLTWQPQPTPNPEIYGDGSGPWEEGAVVVLGRESLSVDESVVQAGTSVQYSTYRVIVPVEQGTIQVFVTIQRADTLDGVLSSIHSVDETRWAAALPARTVTPGERRAAVTQTLIGVPLSDGFDTAALGAARVYSDRYQLIAYVVDAVVCGWLDVWFTAMDNGDSIGEQAAAEALATSRVWPALLEIDPEGGFADLVWERADAVNGDGMLPSGVRLDRLYASNTGCNRFWTGDSLPPDASVPLGAG